MHLEELYSFSFNSVFNDLALIQSFFGIFEIVRTLFPQYTWKKMGKNVKTLLKGQIVV